MAQNNSFVYFEDAEVTRTKKLYRVFLEDEESTFFLKEEIVDSIADQTGEDPNLVAILLANIDYVRKSREKMNGGSTPTKIENKLMVECVSMLLKVISIDELIARFKAMKWHEILKVFDSQNPVEEIEEL